MPVCFLSDDVVFPDPEQAESDGLLAIGGDLHPDRLLTAYSQGIFPCYSQGMPILWWSPDPRPVIYPDRLHVPKRLLRFLRHHPFEVTLDQDFYGVIRGCATVTRGTSSEVWLLPEMIAAYERLYHNGYAHSVEIWKDGELVGGFYGVALGKVFFGESMFHRCSEAVKVGFVLFVRYLSSLGFTMLDCQQTSGHMLRFGAVEISRHAFLAGLREGMEEGWESDVGEGCGGGLPGW
ncbi:MAG: leucyl/phenylalanyl-tRNA--protein transferase [Deltaproteobacteria bacterium]|nr:MAG: leucyl/phenylalanyl-tRNA--protein transferase [Deltaproteobacteria bacterium]